MTNIQRMFLAMGIITSAQDGGLYADFVKAMRGALDLKVLEKACDDFADLMDKLSLEEQILLATTEMKKAFPEAVLA